MRRSLPWIAAAALLLSGCQAPARNRAVERLQLIQTLGYDAEGSRVTVSASSGHRPGDEPPVLLSARGESISDAAGKLRGFSPREELFFAHVRFAVMGEDAARQGAAPLLDYFERGAQTTLSVPLLVVRNGTAREMVTSSADPEYEVTAQLAALRRDTQQRGTARFFTLREVAARLARSGAALCCAVKALPCEENVPSAREGALSLVEAGYAVLKNGALAGFLDPDAALGADLIMNRAGEADYVLRVPDGTATVALRRCRTRLDVLRDADGAVTLEVTTRAAAGVLDARGADPGSENTLELLGAALGRAMAAQEAAALAASGEMEADFMELGLILMNALPPGKRGEALVSEMGWRVRVEVVVERSYDINGTPAAEGGHG